MKAISWSTAILVIVVVLACVYCAVAKVEIPQPVVLLCAALATAVAGQLPQLFQPKDSQ